MRQEVRRCASGRDADAFGMAASTPSNLHIGRAPRTMRLRCWSGRAVGSVEQNCHCRRCAGRGRPVPRLSAPSGPSNCSAGNCRVHWAVPNVRFRPGADVPDGSASNGTLDASAHRSGGGPAGQQHGRRWRIHHGRQSSSPCTVTRVAASAIVPQPASAPSRSAAGSGARAGRASVNVLPCPSPVLATSSVPS